MKKLIITNISVTCLLFATYAALGQNAQKADKLYDRMGYQVAIDHYGDSEDLTLQQQIRLAESHRLNGQSKQSEMLYRNILKVDQDPVHYFHFAQALMMNNKVDEAIANFKIHKSILSENDPDQRADNYLRFIQSGSFDQVDNTIIKNIESINTDNFEFSPFIINDGLLFISSRPLYKQSTLAAVNYSDFNKTSSEKDLWTEKDYNKIYKSTEDQEGNLSQTDLLSESLGGLLHQGPLHMKATEDLLYFTASHTVDGLKSKNARNIVPLEIYKSILIDGDWSTPVSFNEINTTEYNEAHPTLSINGRTIIFSSDRAEGQGGMDLYIAHKIDGNWATPKNMGPTVNTPGNEVFPFLHPSGKLYFSSDGLGGFGGLDIFQTKIDDKGRLESLPSNSGAPINSNRDDFGYNSTSDDQSGYFSSSRNSSIGRDDIFHFKRGKEKVEESEYEKALTSQENSIIKLNDSNKPLTNILPKSKNNLLDKSNNTSAANLNTTTEDESSAANTTTDDNKSISEGISFTLDKVYYDFDKATLRDESIPELSKLTSFLNQYPDVTIELTSHTDARGPSSYNKSLSQRRAESVVDYLLYQNISPHRIIAKGYGEERLRNRCTDGRDCSEKDHQYNRRTEFKIIDVGNHVNLSYTDNGPSTIHVAGSPSNESFSNIKIKETISQKYSNANTSDIDVLNDQLSVDGSFRITVGAYSNPSKKVSEMETLGFNKVQTAPIEQNSGVSRVLIGAVDNLETAQTISQALYQMGIKNDILKLD